MNHWKAWMVMLIPTGTRGPDWQRWRAGCGPRAASWTTLS